VRHPNAIVVQVDDATIAPRPLPPSKEQLAGAAWDEMAKTGELKDEQVAALIKPRPRFTFQSEHRNRVYEAKQLLGIEDGQVGPEWHYAQLVDAKYVLVVSPSDVHWPTAEGNALTPGTAMFRATLVEIETAKPLGGFQSATKSSETISVEYDRDHALDEAATRKFEQDLMSRYSQAIVKGIEERWPGSKVPTLAWGL
jgi:hypothetical protein